MEDGKRIGREMRGLILHVLKLGSDDYNNVIMVAGSVQKACS